MDTRQKLAGESFAWIQEGNGATEVKNIGKELGSGCYANHVEEVTGKEEVMNIYEYKYEMKKEGVTEPISFR